MNALKYVGVFIFGAGVGVLGSMKYFEAKYEKIANEEIESVVSSRIGMGHIKEKDSMQDEEFNKEIEEELSNPDSEFHSSISDMFGQDVVDKNDEQVEYMEELEEKEHPIKEVDKPDEPIRITEEEYSETEPSFDKLCLHYYTEDDILVSSDSKEVQMGRTIGDEGINEVRLDPDETYFYFRDYLYGCDYEVIKIKGSYYVDN